MTLQLEHELSTDADTQSGQALTVHQLGVLAGEVRHAVDG